MVFGAFLWILLVLIPLQSSPSQFVVHEIRGCCHEQIRLECGDDRSKIAIIQARYIIDHDKGDATPGFHATEDNHLDPARSTVSLWDMDLKFPHEYPPPNLQDSDGWKSDETAHLSSPEWFSPYSRKKDASQYARRELIKRLGQGPTGLNFTDKMIQIPSSYSSNFMDRDTIWMQPMFPVAETKTTYTNPGCVPRRRESNYFANLRSSSSPITTITNLTSLRPGKKRKAKPNWHYMDFRPLFNQQCSGKSSCSVTLLQNSHQRDEELTRVCHKWPDGFVVVKYLCFAMGSDNVHSKCNEDVDPALEGFLINPGYPDVYPGDLSCQWRLHVLQQRILLVLFDISLRGLEKATCRDQLIVSEEATNLFSTCGDHSSAVAVLSIRHQLNVTLVAQSRLAYPKRGFLIYYRVIGCKDPTGPLNSNLAFRNATHAYFICQVGHVFPDTLSRHRWLLCNPLEHHWTEPYPHCEDIRELLEVNADVEEILGSPGLWPSTHRDAYYRMVFRDYIIPSVVLISILVINLMVLMYIRNRRQRQEELENEENQEMEEQTFVGATPEDSTFTLSSGSTSTGEWDRPVLNFAEEDTQLIILQDTNYGHIPRINGHPRSSFFFPNGIAAYANGNVYYTSFCKSTAV